MDFDTVIHADSREFLSSVPDETFDAILTDPPYGVTQDSDDYVATFFLRESYRILKKDAALMMFVGQASLREFWNEAERVGFRWLNTIIWFYRNTIKRERHRFAIQYDPILYFAKGDFHHHMDAVRVPYLSQERLKYPVNNQKKRGWTPNPLGAICGDVWEVPAVVTTSKNGCDTYLGHKWQKPLKLFDRMVRATLSPGQLMLDPFCGSGTSCLAAQQQNVRYVGVDVNMDSVSLSRSRLHVGQKHCIDIFDKDV
jgi:DNA modification methylase